MGKFPELHYLRKGWKDGMDPHPGFSTNWYVSQYPDVIQNGMNPFIHFIRFGMYEERRPSEQGALSDFPELAETSIWYYGLAWIGFIKQGISGLNHLRHNKDLDAAWYLAKWHFRYESYEASLSCLLWLHENGGGRFNVRVPSAIAKCYLNLGRSKDAYHYLLTNEVGSLNAALVDMSQTSFSSDERLASINYLYEGRGLARLSDKVCTKPLSLRHLFSEDSVSASSGSLVSIIMSAFNAEESIEAALESLLTQSWEAIEIIVVNDASTDKTAHLVYSLSQKDNRIHLINNHDNKGAYASRNIGMQAARGEFITVHDSDDWSHPQKIESQVQALIQDPDKMASQSYWVRVDPEMRAIGPGHMDLDWLEPNASSYMYRREVLDTLGYWHEVRVSADTEYVDRLRAYYGNDTTVDVMPDLPLSFSLVRTTSLTRNVMTHSRTFHYGLRNLYHQATQWWHRKQNKGVSMYHEIGSMMPFPVPIGNQPKPCLKYDVLVIANGSNQNHNLLKVVEVLTMLHQQGLSIVLYSWSLANDFKSTSIADDVWQICQQYNVGIAHEGLTLECQEVYVSEEECGASLPDNPPKLSHPAPIRGLDGSSVSDELRQRLDAYLR